MLTANQDTKVTHEKKAEGTFMATWVHVRPQPFSVGATPQVSVSRSASPAQLIHRGRGFLVFGSWAALAFGAWNVHNRGCTVVLAGADATLPSNISNNPLVHPQGQKRGHAAVECRSPAEGRPMIYAAVGGTRETITSI